MDHQASSANALQRSKQSRRTGKVRRHALYARKKKGRFGGPR